MKRKKKSPLRPVILGGLLLLAVVMARWGIGRVIDGAYERTIHLPDRLQAKVDLLPDRNAVEGTPNAQEVEGDGASFQVVLNRYPTMDTGESPCNLWAENPESNPYDLRVSLYLKDTGELLGATHRIERGKRVDEITLDRVLAAGEYPLLAKLELFDETQTAAGQLTVELSLLVRG